jgi:channel protein (hemolysin III family)
MVVALIPPDAPGVAAAAAGPALLHLHGFWDPFSAASHLIGAVVFLILGLRLVRRGGPDRARQLALGVYVACGVMLLLLSGLYHMATGGTAASRLLVRFDHAAIFFLIAGTFTPIHMLHFRGALRWVPLAFVWTAAFVGAVFKTLFFYSVPESVGLSMFLVMGWLGLVGGFVLLRREGIRFVSPLLLGGAAFSAGAIMEFFRWPTLVPGLIHAHEVFHVAALVGFAFHFAFMWQFASPAWTSRSAAVANADAAGAAADAVAEPRREARRRQPDERSADFNAPSAFSPSPQ